MLYSIVFIPQRERFYYITCTCQLVEFVKPIT
jgi:hypothetical protein